jgi:hypothetical protein
MHPFRFSPLLFVVAAISVSGTEQLPSARFENPKAIATTPPMGWNSWDCFGMDITEAQVKATADYIAKNLKSAGWEYVVVDMGWYYGEGLNTTNFKTMKSPPQYIDGYSRLIPSERKFPSSANGNGLKPLADYVHSLGLKFGIHILRGIPWQAVQANAPIRDTSYHAQDIVNLAAQCKWYDGLRGLDTSKPGARAYYRSIIELYAQWGVDYVKVDDMEKPYAKGDVEAITDAITTLRHPMVVSLSAGPIATSEVSHLRAHANMWRISNDMWDDWFFIKRQFGLCRTWQDYVSPQHWPDCDMLPLGKLRINGIDDILALAIHKRPEELVNEYSRLTIDEQTTLLTLWYIFRSPLMMGGNVLEYDERLLKIYTNEEALAVNQRSDHNRELRASDQEVVWTAVDSVTGARYVALFNLEDKSPRKIAVQWNELGLAGPHNVRDLWARANLGQHEEKFEVEIAPHGAGLFRIELK